MEKPDIATIIKVLEWLLSITAVGLINSSPYGREIARIQLIDATFIGYLIINTIQLFSQFVLKEKIPQKTKLLIAGSGFILWIASSGCIMEFVKIYAQMNYGLDANIFFQSLSAGVVGLVNGIVYLAEAILLFKKMS